MKNSIFTTVEMAANTKIDRIGRFKFKKKKIKFTIEIAEVRPIFGSEINFTVMFRKQGTEIEKPNGSWLDMVN